MSESREEYHMGVMEEGVLEPIAKLPGSRVQTGMRAPGTAASGRPNFRQTWSSIAPSLEILSPEEILEQQMEDLEIEDFGSGSGTDFTDNEGEDVEKSRETTSLFQILEPGRVAKERTEPGDEDWEKDSEYTAARQISLIEKDAESEVDSEEERDILRDIKNEITQQVKSEMKAELSAMKRKIEKDSGVNEGQEDDLKDVDPDLKMAILKMRKLDRILAKKTRKEKEVKKQRLLLQARLRKEIEDLKPEGRDDIKEVKVNTTKFLALTLPVSHNAGLRITEAGELEEHASPPVTPVFQTQVPYDRDDQSRNKGRGESDSRQETEGAEDDNRSTTSSTATGTSANSKRSRGGKKGRSKRGTDYIKRNIQLAADAGESVAMTDDEKKRIGDLLADLDTVPEVMLEEEDLFTKENPYQITLSTGEGFHPGKEEMQRLEAIDRRLKALMPSADYESIASTPTTLTRVAPSSLFSRTAMGLEADEPAEEALRENKEHRDLQKRLQDIEYQLNSVTSSHNQHVGEDKLSAVQLDRLLDDCAKSLSTDVTMDVTHQDSNRSSTVSSRLSLLEHPPHLPTHVLQQLLAEAGTDTALNTDRDPPDGRSDSQAESHYQQQRAITNGESARTGTPDTMSGLRDHRSVSEKQKPLEILSITGETPEVPNIAQLRQNPGIYKQRDPANEWHQSRTSTGMSSVSPPSTADSSSSKRAPFLPAIDPRGSLSTQKNNLTKNGLSQSRSGSRPKVNTVWGSVDSEQYPKSSSRASNGFRSDSVALENSDGPGIPRPPPSSGGNGRTASRKGSGRSVYSLQDLE